MIWQLNDVLTTVQCDNILSVYQENRFHCGSDSNPREGVKKTSVLDYDDPDYRKCVDYLYGPIQKATSGAVPPIAVKIDRATVVTQLIDPLPQYWANKLSNPLKN